MLYNSGFTRVHIHQALPILKKSQAKITNILISSLIALESLKQMIIITFPKT